ncbi:hypothetical protein Droror1_Dr00024444 [Drosera rotundifolia]
MDPAQKPSPLITFHPCPIPSSSQSPNPVHLASAHLLHFLPQTRALPQPPNPDTAIISPHQTSPPPLPFIVARARRRHLQPRQARIRLVDWFMVFLLYEAWGGLCWLWCCLGILKELLVATLSLYKLEAAKDVLVLEILWSCGYMSSLLAYNFC